MKKIVLACAAGFSTSMLVAKMKEAAEEKGLDLWIGAVAESDIDDHLDSDILLLGPQIAYRLDDLRAELDLPVFVIESFDYGTMNGKAVLEFALGEGGTYVG